LSVTADSRRADVTLEGFFDTDALTLMYPPTTSKAALEDATATGNVPDGVRRFPATDSVYVGRLMGLRPEYGPPSDALCLGFHNEGGLYDVVRCRYRVGIWGFEYAKTSQMASLRVACPDVAGSPLEVATIVAARIFEPAEGVILGFVGSQHGVSFGHHDLERTGARWTGKPVADAYMAHWRDLLQWWHENHAVGFVALRKWGGEKQMMAAAGRTDWFSGDYEGE
jgi:hypothetical protein